MELLDNPRYLETLQRCDQAFPDWGQLHGKTLFLSGATGMIGSFLVDTIMHHNQTLPKADRCHLIAVSRSRSEMERRFAPWGTDAALMFLEQDISQPLGTLPQRPDYWIHAASVVHPLGYATQPVNTILANVLGAHYILECAAQNPQSRFLFLSTVDIYGENRGDTEYFKEDYCGYMNCNTLRADYFESKRVSEAMCQAYIAQHGVDARIIRLPRCYGPTMRMEDTKAISQFIKNGVRGENIVLKSAGQQHFSFAHTSDAVLGLLWVLIRGKTGEAYNLGDRRSDITQKELAEQIAQYAGTEVVFAVPDEQERSGYSPATKALMDAEKLKNLGWSAQYDITSGICETIDILRAMNEGAQT